MKHLSVVLIVVALSMLHLSCKKDEGPCTTCPPPQPTNCQYPPGNRNFTWRLDTVAWWPSTLGGVWAFSDSDAWVMGNMHGPTVPGQTSYLGLHWNGLKWNDTVRYDQVQHLSNDVTGDVHHMVAVGHWAIENPKAGLAEFDNRTKQWTPRQFQTQGELRSIWTDGNGFFIAAGDNGMVYTKDGYTAGWVYSQAPTTMNFTKVMSVSKHEIYLRATLSLAIGQRFYQMWRFSQNGWIKLLDTQDTTGTPIQMPGTSSEVNDIEAYRCAITDSVFVYIAGRECFEVRSKGDALVFTTAAISLPYTNLSWGRIFLFSPNDYWVTRLEYHMYHWNGSNFQKIEPIAALPYGQPWGAISSIKRNQSGKTWVVLEMSSQVYAVLQGVP